MTVLNPPAWLQAGTYQARIDRLGATSFLRTGGAVSRSSLVVTSTTTPSMAVRVSEGAAYVQNTFGTRQGYYCVVNTGTITIPIAAASTTGWRLDLVIARVRDTAYSGASDEASIEVVAGTPAKNPSPPVIPANSIILATVSVKSGAKSVTNADISISNRQTAQFEADLIRSMEFVTSTSRPLNPFDGQRIYETNTGAERFWDGTRWKLISPTTIPVFTSTSRPSGSRVWQGMLIYESDTGRIRMYRPDGKWMIVAGGAPIVAADTSLSFTHPNGRTNWRSATGKGLKGLSLWINEANQKAHMGGHIINNIVYNGWSATTDPRWIARIPSSLVPEKDFVVPTHIMTSAYAFHPIALLIRGKNSGNMTTGSAGDIYWKGNTAVSTTYATDTLYINVPELTWSI